MKIAVCEDEVWTGLELKAMIEASGREATLYSDAQLLLADWEAGRRFDVIFTDIVMENGFSGMDLCRRLSAEGKAFLVVVTNYIEYAPEGYRNGVFRYLLKPIEKDMLEQVFAEIDKAEKEARKNGKMVVEAFDGERVIEGEHILYVEVQGRYLDIYLRDERGTESVVMLMRSLKEFSANLPENRFVRINRNQLVNLERVSLVKQGSLVLDSGRTLSVSRRQQRELQEALARCLA